jgi:hypothetical protein
VSESSSPFELVGVPAVVLVGERYVVGGRRREREPALEVAVEADAPRRARQNEPRVAPELLLDGAVTLRACAVVAHDADPVAVSLRPQRLDLAPEQLGGGLVRGHADHDEGSVRGLRRAELERRLRRDDADSAELGEGVRPVREASPK